MRNADIATCNVYSKFLDQVCYNLICAFTGLVCNSLKFEATRFAILLKVVLFHICFFISFFQGCYNFFKVVF